MQLTFPVCTNPVPGSQFVTQIPDALCPQRESAIKDAILAGNVPSFFSELYDVTASWNGHVVVYSVTKEYLCVGVDGDWIRTPLNPITAQAVADGLQCVLPTKKMVDQIHAAAETKLTPQPIPWTQAWNSVMTTTQGFLQHETVVGMATPGLLVDGHKKNVVITPKIYRTDRVAIYGWMYPNGNAIQGLNPSSHNNVYADYSHGIRLISTTATLDGNPVDTRDVMKDPVLCVLLSDEGPVAHPRYD